MCLTLLVPGKHDKMSSYAVKQTSSHSNNAADGVFLRYGGNN